MDARLDRITVLVADMDRAVTFYRDVLGLAPLEVSAWWSEFETGGTRLALHRGPRAEGAGARGGTDAGTLHIAFDVPDIDAACSELRAKGVEVDGPRLLEGMELRLATFADPDGASLGIEGR